MSRFILVVLLYPLFCQAEEERPLRERLEVSYSVQDSMRLLNQRRMTVPPKSQLMMLSENLPISKSVSVDSLSVGKTKRIQFTIRF